LSRSKEVEAEVPIVRVEAINLKEKLVLPVPSSWNIQAVAETECAVVMKVVAEKHVGGDACSETAFSADAARAYPLR